ncbi:MAG: DEAD/DEAH box helicase [Nitrospirota bacterium]|nr:DEAD/DEAH box helicase [Nitrospirota bacterium]
MFKFRNVLKRFMRRVTSSEELPQRIEITEDYPCSTEPDPDIPFPMLNPLQSCFRDLYSPKRNSVVESGTGTGKTALTYIASRYFLDEGKRVVLTAPTRELVKNLYADSKGVWGAKVVGMNTGYDKNVAGKYVIVTTPEGYISAVRSGKEWTKAGLLIVDEAHNLLDPSRSGELDVAIVMFIREGGKVLLMSGTFPNKDAVADLLNADLFISRYRSTKISLHEIHAPDDIDALPAPKTPSSNLIVTTVGLAYNKESVRVKVLKDILNKHHGESVLVFVPTKAAGFCLSESLVAPFHCADIDEAHKDKIVADFRKGELKTLLATNTLSQGINTPADVVIVCGIRRGNYYLDFMDVGQMIGRAGRGKPEATAYIIGDKIELFHAKKYVMAKSLPLPVESMVLTLLSLNAATRDDLYQALGMTFAATYSNSQKITETVDSYIRFLKACNILVERDGKLTLTKEGALISRYYLSPKAYMGYITLARRLDAVELPDVDKGCMLLSGLLPLGGYRNCPARYEKDMLMKLIQLELDKSVSHTKAGLLKYYLNRPSAIPPFLPYQLRDAERWIGMLNDMVKYRIHQTAPGLNWLKNTTMALKTAATKGKRRNKPVQISLM